jgi:hypothetical protein
MLSVNSLDVPLKISLCCFAISIPSLTAVFLSIKGKGEIMVDTPHRLLTFLWTIGNLTSLFGILRAIFPLRYLCGRNLYRRLTDRDRGMGSTLGDPSEIPYLVNQLYYPPTFPLVKTDRSGHSN